MVALSDLSLESHSQGLGKEVEGIDGSFYFRKSNRTGIRMIGLQSGGDGFEPVEPLYVPVWFLLNCILRIVSLPFRIVVFFYIGIMRLLGKWEVDDR